MLRATDKITALYCRLSVEDTKEKGGKDDPSNSIQHQRILLEKYAKDNGFENVIFLADDGYSGTNFERPSWKQVIDMIERDEVETLIVKDLSRLGCEYLQVGYYTEIYFPQKGVRFIAVNDGVDSLVASSTDFNPIRNWANELHAKDTSKKVRAIKRSQFHLKCYTYGKKGKKYCTPHQIRESDLKQVVLDDLRRVTHFARMKERQFASYINAKNSAELRQEINALQRELDTMQRRSDELTALFKRLYEDNVLGRITNEQFRRLSAGYNAEQKTPEEAIPVKQERLAKLKASAANVEAFIEKAKRFRSIDELTPELLRLFIQRIEIGERAKKYSHSAAQDIRIVYRDIGVVDSNMEKGEQPVHMVTLPQSIDEIVKMLA